MDMVHVKGKGTGKVILYALSTCVWCKNAKKLLIELGGVLILSMSAILFTNMDIRCCLKKPLADRKDMAWLLVAKPKLLLQRQRKSIDLLR